MPQALSSAVWLASQTSQDRLRSSSTRCLGSYRDGDEDGETETRDRDGDENGDGDGDRDKAKG